MQGTPDDLKNSVDDNSPDDAARVHIEKMKETCRERIAYHMDQHEKLLMIAKQHEYAAQQYRILISGGEPVPEDHDLREARKRAAMGY